MRRLAHESLWILGCALVALILTLLEPVQGAQARAEWLVGTLSLVVLATVARVIAWAIGLRHIDRRFWLDAALVAGLCLLTYAASARYDDTDRYLLTLGAGIALTAVLLKRRL